MKVVTTTTTTIELTEAEADEFKTVARNALRDLEEQHARTKPESNIIGRIYKEMPT